MSLSSFGIPPAKAGGNAQGRGSLREPPPSAPDPKDTAGSTLTTIRELFRAADTDVPRDPNGTLSFKQMVSFLKEYYKRIEKLLRSKKSLTQQAPHTAL